MCESSSSLRVLETDVSSSGEEEVGVGRLVAQRRPMEWGKTLLVLGLIAYIVHWGSDGV